MWLGSYGCKWLVVSDWLFFFQTANCVIFFAEMDEEKKKRQKYELSY